MATNPLVITLDEVAQVITGIATDEGCDYDPDTAARVVRDAYDNGWRGFLADKANAPIYILMSVLTPKLDDAEMLIRVVRAKVLLSMDDNPECEGC